MEREGIVCERCREVGLNKHPGSEQYDAPGGIQYRYVY